MNRNKLLIICLLLSLAVNLLLIGGITSRTMSRPDFSAGRPFPPNLGWVMRGLSDARRSELSSLQESSAEAILPSRREMSVSQERINQLMAADPLDAAAIEQAFSELRQANLDYQRLSHQQTVDMLKQLTVAERQQALDFLSSRRFRGGGDRRPRGGSGSRPSPRPATDPSPDSDVTRPR